MTYRHSLLIRIGMLLLLQVMVSRLCWAQLSWPAGQLLPSFPLSAQTQDLIVLREMPSDELYLFASLKGIVNRTQPRIFSYQGDEFAEGKYAWLEALGLNWNEPADKWDLVTKYLDEISGLIVYDPEQIHTVNLATTLAQDRKALIVSPELLPKLNSAPYNLPILVDLRGRFTSKLQVYQELYDTYWPDLDRRILIGLSADGVKASLREYATALGAAVIWLDPYVYEERKLLERFLSSMPKGSCYLGWWPDEGAGVTTASKYGIVTIASDYCTNLTVHSGMPREINIKPKPPKPTLQNKIYVAFIISDGDNLQYIEHSMMLRWQNADRGSVPIGWTVSPAMVDAMPGALNYFHQTSTVNDNLISGPSGYGYVYPKNFPSQTLLNEFVAKTDEYNKAAGLRVITIWNSYDGPINQSEGETYAKYAPSLLGLTAQNTGAPFSIYDNSLPGFPLSCNYCTGEEAMKDHIAYASQGWNRDEPRFVLIQAQPWQGVGPTAFKNVANSLNPDYVVVRPDHFFQLLRESQGLLIDPLIPMGKDITDLGGMLSAQYQSDAPVGKEYTNLTDNNEETKYVTYHDSAWIQYQAPSSYVVKTYTITSAKDLPDYDPLNWTLLGSNDGTSWTTLDTRTNEEFWDRSQTRIFNINNQTGYTYFRFNITNNSGSRLQLAEIELFGRIITEMRDTLRKGEISLYPNPVFSELAITGIEANTEVAIYDLCGKLMLRKTIASQEKPVVNIESLNSGTYLLKKAGRHTEVLKFVKK